MKKILLTVSTIILCITVLTGCNKDEEKIKIGVAQIVEHASLNTIRDSFKQQMKELGYDEDKAIIEYKDAGGDQSLLNSIMQTYSGNKMDVIVAIATPTAQAASVYRKDIPIVFSAVSYPIQAGLLNDMDHPDKNITGTCDEIQVDQILSLALELNPNIKTIGFIYNASEANSVENLKKAQEFVKDKNIELIVSSVVNSSEVKQTAELLANKSDVIFTPNDNMIASAMPSLAKACLDKKVPLYTGADSMVKDGGFASIGIDYEELGKETANMVDEIIKGKDVKDIPVKQFKTDLNIYINKDVQKKLGIKLSDRVLNSDRLVYLGKDK